MGERSSRNRSAGACAALIAAALLLAPAARAEVTSVFGGDVPCAPQPANGNVRLCGGPTVTWDGVTKIDVNVILPPAGPGGAEGPYPLIGDFHGWGGSKIGLNAQTQAWAESGYAVFSMSDRGWGESCGAQDPDRILARADCAAGYNHLMDDRYEVRDAQYLISVLADEGIARPDRIGATGVSYGGGLSLALAALRDRTMLPDGSLVPWQSPGGKQMSLAAAVPQWPWSDLAYSLMPNGSTLDYVADSPYRGPDGKAPIGVEKSSYVSGLYGLGLAQSNYAPPGMDPGADLTAWYGLISAGEPYDQNPQAEAIVEEITAHHSAYYIDHSRPPAPLLIQSGWNDDLFPADEAIRFYNRTRTQYPGDPISLYFMDDGHARSQNKEADARAFEAREDAWFDYYLKGSGVRPASSVEALTTVCGGPSEGPYRADDWRDLAPGEIRFDSAAPQTILPGSGDPGSGQAFDPIAGGGACASVSATDQSGVANYRLPAAPSPGFTLIGSPTIVADISSTGPESELAARLLDVSPEGSERLVARGLLRPGEGGTGIVFQLHPQAYRFAPGHVPKLELLPSDAPYARPSNAQLPITVSNLELRLPVLEPPGSLGGVVQPPAPKVLPPGYRLAGDYRSGAGSPGVAAGGPAPRRRPRAARLLRRMLVGPALLRGRRLHVEVRCPAAFRARCRLSLQGLLRPRRAATRARAATLGIGRKRTLGLRVVPSARRALRRRRRLLFRLRVRSGGGRGTVLRRLRIARRPLSASLRLLDLGARFGGHPPCRVRLRGGNRCPRY